MLVIGSVKLEENAEWSVNHAKPSKPVSVVRIHASFAWSRAT